ncbi:fimbrial protein [Providencia sp. Me31A]|uniref:fimbrial protein n=1 Tax=Providencia sp. Me31A TaxID=3392637 RepID=UPI003D294CF5
MKLNKLAIFSIFTMALSVTATQAATGDGTINFSGKVIDSPCGIATESASQSIDFGQISKSLLEKNGISQIKQIPIKLINCDLTKAGTDDEAATSYKGVKVTFNGNIVTGTKSELATTGNTGTAIVISSSTGSLVNFNEAGGLQALGNNSNTLLYTTWAKKATNGSIAEGEFNATTNFTLAYE